MKKVMKVRKMTREEARAWQRRWQVVNEAERRELRATPATVKLRQLTELMSWVRPLGWTAALKEGEEEVRQRWKRLREHYGV